MNLLLRQGVRTCLDYAQNRDLPRAKLLANPDNAPHVEFVDMGGHGYAIVQASSKCMDVELVCIPRPVTDNTAPTVVPCGTESSTAPSSGSPDMRRSFCAPMSKAIWNYPRSQPTLMENTMKLEPAFQFDGNGTEAMSFYAALIHGVVDVAVTWGKSPMSSDVPSGYEDKLMHASVRFGDQLLMGSDALPAGTFRGQQSVSRSLYLR